MALKRTNETKNVLLELVAVTFLASASIFVRNSKLPPINTGLWRMILAAPFLFLLSFKDLKNITFKDALFSFFSGVLLSGDITFFNMSLVMTSAANTNLITNLTPLITIPISYFVFKEKVSKMYLVGLGISMVGAILLVTGKASPSNANYIGDFYAGCACIFYALYFLCTYKIRDRVKSSTLMFFGAFGSIFGLTITSSLVEGLKAPSNINEFMLLLAFAICMQVIGQNLLAHCQGKISINLSSAITLLQPVIAAIIAFIAFGEMLTAKEMFAIAVAICGVYICKKQFR